MTKLLTYLFLFLVSIKLSGNTTFTINPKAKNVAIVLNTNFQNPTLKNYTYVNGTLDSVYINGNQYCYTTNQSATPICTPIDTTKLPLVIRDGEGNQYVINEGPPPTVTGPTSYITLSTDQLAATDNLKVEFIQNTNQAFGFDKKEYGAFIDNYETINLSNNKNYFVPNKSIGQNSTDVVSATFTITNFNPSQLSFKTKTNALLSATQAGNTFNISNIPANADCIYAWYNNQKIGKLNIVSLNKVTKKVVLVPVNGANTSITQQGLNDVYKQANTIFTLTTAPNFTFNLGNDGLEAADANLMSKYSAEMRALRDAYKKKDSLYDKSAYYIFVVPNFSNPLLQGYMVRGRALGFVKARSAAEALEAAKDVAHELAHGAFKLEHTFDAIAKGTSNNLMDYNNGTHLVKSQWLNIQNPTNELTWFDEEEDGSYETDGHYSTVYLVCLMLGMDNSKAEELAVATENPDTDIHSEIDFEIDQTWAYPDAQQEIHSLTGGFHTVEEMMTAFKILYISKSETKKIGELLHRYGDTYAHTRLDNFMPASLKNYEFQDTTKLRLYILQWKNQGAPRILDRIAPWIDFLNYQISILGYNFLTNETFQKQKLNNKTLVQYLHSVYPNQPIDKLKVYGDGNYTTEHASTDKGLPDFIYVRPQWYLSYVQNLFTILSYKYNEYTGNLDLNLFQEMVSFASLKNCSLKGIIDYEIAKKQGKRTFYIPVFYSKADRIAASVDAVLMTDYLQVAKDALSRTKEYLDQKGVLYTVETINGNKTYYNKNGTFKTKAFKISY